MAVIDTVNGLQITRQNWTPGPARRYLRFYDSHSYEYAELYRLQPNVRTCVDFLARNIAQLGLYFYRRVSDTDRERLTDFQPARLIKQPLPARYKTTRYRQINALISDLGIYFNAYWLKIRMNNDIQGLLRIPPPYVNVLGGLVPTGYEITLSGKMVTFDPDDIVHFWGYNPENPILGLSPLETLRQVLAEEHAAGQYRENFWQNAARQSGVIKRPATAPEWSDTARERFTAEFEELYAGAENSGKTIVLEEGMEYQNTSFDAQESEYLGGRKLTREECARAYHIPLPMVGILDHATFSNIEEQHKNLYQDSLGPWLEMVEEDVDLQLVSSEYPDTEDVYSEFNIAQKLQGSFEEQVKSLQSAVGRPWMTANEARAKQNLPSLGGDADQLVTPLNVLVGGQASPRDATPEQRALNVGGKKAAGFSSYAPELRKNHVEKWTQVLAGHYRRQELAIVSRVPKGRKMDIGGVWYDETRWNKELAEDLLKVNRLTAVAWAELISEQTGMATSEDVMMAWLIEHSRVQAENINLAMRVKLTAALNEADADEAVRDLFRQAITVWAQSDAETAVTSASQFGAHEAARAGGLRTKTWRVHSDNPRPSHSRQNGMTIPIGDSFPNGLKWPGQPGPPAEVANCQCSVEFGV